MGLVVAEAGVEGVLVGKYSNYCLSGTVLQFYPCNTSLRLVLLSSF